MGLMMCLSWIDVYISGRQPFRSGLYGQTNVVLPIQRIGLSHDEITIAEALHDNAGYSTGILGKWHLGRVVIYLHLSFRVLKVDITAVVCDEIERTCM